jgi:FMN phosphatase YigB (HAD superfamily)
VTTIKAVLLDLDNTLLYNPDRPFAMAFLSALNEHFLAAIGYTGTTDAVRQFIGLTHQGRDGTQSNSALFYDLLAQATGQTAQTLQNVMASFYRDVYPALRSCVKLIPNAARLVNLLYDGGFAVVIATNPIYAASAIQQRMVWAGLPDPENRSGRYALVTSADNMHFSKPDPAYYAEILGRVGVEPDEALLLGDSERNDMLPGQRLGLHTYPVHAENPLQLNEVLARFAGQVQDASWRERLLPPKLQPTMIEPQLRGNIGALYGILSEVGAGQWLQRPDPDQWSILQVLCHLASNEDEEQRLRLQRILNEANPFIIAPKPPGPDIPLCDEDGYQTAARFAQSRQQTLELIAQIAPDAWLRPARHSIFGLTTLLEMAYFTAQHDRLHLNQLCQTLGRCE